MQFIIIEEIVELLIKAGADKDIQDENGWTALMFAAKKGHIKIVELLIKAKANKDIQGNR